MSKVINTVLALTIFVSTSLFPYYATAQGVANAGLAVWRVIGRVVSNRAVARGHNPQVAYDTTKHIAQVLAAGVGARAAYLGIEAQVDQDPGTDFVSAILMGIGLDEERSYRLANLASGAVTFKWPGSSSVNSGVGVTIDYPKVVEGNVGPPISSFYAPGYMDSSNGCFGATADLARECTVTRIDVPALTAWEQSTATSSTTYFRPTQVRFLNSSWTTPEALPANCRRQFSSRQALVTCMHQLTDVAFSTMYQNNIEAIKSVPLYMNYATRSNSFLLDPGYIDWDRPSVVCFIPRSNPNDPLRCDYGLRIKEEWKRTVHNKTGTSATFNSALYNSILIQTTQSMVSNVKTYFPLDTSNGKSSEVNGELTRYYTSVLYVDFASDNRYVGRSWFYNAAPIKPNEVLCSDDNAGTVECYPVSASASSSPLECQGVVTRISGSLTCHGTAPVVTPPSSPENSIKQLPPDVLGADVPPELMADLIDAAWNKIVAEGKSPIAKGLADKVSGQEIIDAIRGIGTGVKVGDLINTGGIVRDVPGQGVVIDIDRIIRGILDGIVGSPGFSITDPIVAPGRPWECPEWLQEFCEPDDGGGEDGGGGGGTIEFPDQMDVVVKNFGTWSNPTLPEPPNGRTIFANYENFFPFLKDFKITHPAVACPEFEMNFGYGKIPFSLGCDIFDQASVKQIIAACAMLGFGWSSLRIILEA